MIYIEYGLAANNRIGNVRAQVYMGVSAAIELVDAVAIGNVITADPNEVISIRGDGESRSICRRNYIYGYALPPTDCAASDNVVSVDF